MIAWLTLLSLAQAATPYDDARIVVAIGNNVGVGSDEPLDYAEHDAQRFYKLMTEIGGVSPDRAYIVVGKDAASVRKVLHEARGRIKELVGQRRASLIVFVSAHADRKTLHLAGTELPISELHSLVRTSAADLKLTVIDACQTAARTKTKGGQPVPEVAVTFGSQSRVDGDVLITSASPGEPAQERAFLRGALFSHHLVTGLRGAADVDRDQAVSLTEAYSYAYRRTAAAAVLGGGPQNPSFAFDTKGFGTWILTRPGDHHASLVLGRGIEGAVWIANRKHELVAEVSKARSETLRLALPSGWYRIVQPDGAVAHVADVNLGWGGVREVTAANFTRVRMAESTLRGSKPIELRPWQLAAGYVVGANPLPGPDIEHLAMLRVLRSFGGWQARLHLTGTTQDFRAANGQVQNRALGFGAGGAYTIPIAWLTFGIGAELNLTWVHQTFDRTDQDTIERVFDLREPDRSDWVVGGTAVSFLAIPLNDRFWIQLEAAAGGARVPSNAGTELNPILRMGLLATVAM